MIERLFGFFADKVSQQYTAMATLSLLFFSQSLSASTLEDFFSGLQSLQGKFVQQSLSGSDQPRLQGEFQLRRPDHFRWQYQTPYAQTIITDGHRLWLYDADLDQVSIKPMSSAMVSSGPAALLTTSKPLAELFSIAALPPLPSGEDWYELLPRNQGENQEFEKIRIALYAHQLVAMVIFDMLGNATEIRFSKLKKNLPIADVVFKFVPPAGSDIIDETGQ